MAWNDFSNMPWMQTSKPGEALLRGVEAGSGVAANMNRSRGLQLEANEQSHLLPLKQQMMETQVKEGALQLATGLKAQEYDLQTKQGQAELADVYTKAANVPDGWANPQVRGWMGEVGKKYPALVGTPAWQHGDQNVEKALSINAEQKRAETMAAARTEVAGIGGQTRLGAAAIGAGSREAVAGINAASREKREQMRESLNNPTELKVGESQPVVDHETGEDTGMRVMWNGHRMIPVPRNAGQTITNSEMEKTMEAWEKTQKALDDPGISPETFTRLKGINNRRMEAISKGVQAPAKKTQPASPAKSVPAAPEARVSVINPDGTPGSLPASKVKEAVDKYGFKLQSPANDGNP